MTDIKPIQNEYVTVKGPYGVLNEGTGYAIVNIYTGERIAQNIPSFLDCVKTIDYLLDKSESQGKAPDPKLSSPATNEKLETAIQGLKSDVQRLIRKYAPETVRVSKKSNLLSQSRYKCYDASGNVLGRVRGSSSDRYWQYGQKFLLPPRPHWFQQVNSGDYPKVALKNLKTPKLLLG